MLSVFGAVLFANRGSNWGRGTPDNRATTGSNAKRRFADFRTGVYMRTLLREPAAGVMHSLIYFPFLVLLAVTTVLEVNHQVPEGVKFLHGDTYRAFTAVGDVAGVLFLVGVVWALLRRYGPRRFRPYRIRIKSRPEHAAVLLVFLAIGVPGFGAEAFRIALVDASSRGAETWSVVGHPLASVGDRFGLLAGAGHMIGRFAPARLYERFYCARGDMENRIKEQQLDLFADRTSTHWEASNQLRLWFSAFAHLILSRLQAEVLKGTQWARASIGQIRLKLFKIAARVRISSRRVHFELASAYPWREAFRRAHANLLLAGYS